MKLKNIFTSFLAGACLLSFSSTAFATSNETSDIIVDSVPEAIEIDEDIVNDSSSFQLTEESINKSRMILITHDVKNVSKASGLYWYPSSPVDVLMIDGPSSVNDTYTRSVSAQFSGSITADFGSMSSNFGWNYAISQSKSTSVSFTIPNNQKAQLSLFGLYEKYTYDVYRNGVTYICTNTYYKPIGLKYTLNFYRK